MWSILYWNEGMGFQGRLALALAGAVNRLGQQRLCYNGEPCKEGAAMGVSRGGQGVREATRQRAVLQAKTRPETGLLSHARASAA